MTIEQILDCSADQLEKLSKEDCNKFFEPYLKVTRPEQARVIKEHAKQTGKPSGKAALELEAMRVAQQFGLDLHL